METFLADEEDPSDPEWDEAARCLCMVGEPLLILGSGAGGELSVCPE